MEKEFIPYEEALALKELGFDEKCLGYYNDDQGKEDEIVIRKCNYEQLHDYTTVAPLYQQAFRWFREEGFDFYIQYNVYTSVKFYEVHIREEGSQYVFGKSLTYEEAELACLKKLIEIVQKKLAQE